jgi:hypothetical protein
MIRPAPIALAAVLALAACASPTPYAPADGRFGYADTRIETNRYRISFSGNTLTPRDTVENALLFRAAEITRDTGNRSFRMVARDTEAESRVGSGGFATFGYGGWGWGGGHRRYGGTGIALGVPVYAGPAQTRYTATAEIVVSAEPAPADDPSAYDAAEVLASLAPRIRRPDPEG